VNAWAGDAVEVLLDAAAEVEVEGVQDPAAVDRTEAIATTAGVVEVLLDAGVVEVVDGVLVDAVDDEGHFVI
jgi:hypothetical protein